MLKIFDFPQHTIAFLTEEEYNNIYSCIKVINEYNKNPDKTFNKDDYETHKNYLKEDLEGIFITTGLDSKQFTIVNYGISNYNSLKPIWPCIQWPVEPYSLNVVSSYFSPTYYKNNLHDFRKYPNGYLQHGEFIPCEDFGTVIKELEKISPYFIVLKKKVYIENPYLIKDEFNPAMSHKKNVPLNGIRMALLNMGEII
jgi:hypothetical protein